MKIHKVENCNHLVFMCPACECGHYFNDTWNFNGDMEKPTVSPSILVTGTNDDGSVLRCHSFITNGTIKFLNDCSHSIRGDVQLKDF